MRQYLNIDDDDDILGYDDDGDSYSDWTDFSSSSIRVPPSPSPTMTSPFDPLLPTTTTTNMIMMMMMTTTTTTITQTVIPEVVHEHEIDALICKEMNELSLQERERTFDEIHGVHPIVNETPELIPLAIQQFQWTISQIQHKPAYLLAREQSESYVTSPQFALMFLRSTSFDVPTAAQKCVDYCQGKLDLFGVDTLTRSVHLSDLDGDDLACLKSGAYQMLNTRDSAGRCVILDFHLTMPRCYREPKNLVRFFPFVWFGLVCFLGGWVGGTFVFQSPGEVC